MPQTKWCALVVALLGFWWPSLSAACFLVPAQTRPIECAESVAFSVRVEEGVLVSAEPGQAYRLEERLLAAGIRGLGEARIALDETGHTLRLEILGDSDGGVLIAVSSRDPGGDDSLPTEKRLENDRDALSETLPIEIEATPEDVERVALDLLDQAIRGNRASSCDPERTLSADGRYAFEASPRNPEARARYVSALRSEGVEMAPGTAVGSLWALWPDGNAERLSTFELTEQRTPEKYLVANDGRTVVSFDLRQPRYSRSDFPEGITYIYRADGSVVRSLTLDDLLTPDDRKTTLQFGTSAGYITPLSSALDDERNHLLLTLKDNGKEHRLAVDLETGRLLTPRRDRLAQLRVTPAPFAATGNLEPIWRTPICTGSAASDSSAAWEVAERFHVPAGAFFAQGVARAVPEYTNIAKRARLQGTVEVETVVTETGRVACVRVSPLPMGLDKSAQAAALQWRFRPFEVDGKPVRAIGRFSFRFGLVDPPDAE